MGSTREELFDLAKGLYGTEPDYPWGDNNAVLRHQPSRKWYAVILEVGRSKLGLSGEGTVDVVNVKAIPKYRQSIIAALLCQVAHSS